MWVCNIHYLVVICVACMTWFGLFWKPLKSCPHYNWRLSLRLRWWFRKFCENNSTVIESILNIDVTFMKLRHKIQLVAMLWFKLFPPRPAHPVLRRRIRRLCVVFVSDKWMWWCFFFSNCNQSNMSFASVAQCGGLSAPCVLGLGYHANQENQLQDTRPRQLALLGQGRHEDPKRSSFWRPATDILQGGWSLQHTFACWEMPWGTASIIICLVWNEWVAIAEFLKGVPQSFPHASMFINDLWYFKG